MIMQEMTRQEKKKGPRAEITIQKFTKVPVVVTLEILKEFPEDATKRTDFNVELWIVCECESNLFSPLATFWI